MIGKQAALNPKMTDLYFKGKATLYAFNKDFQTCENKIYKFDSNDFCINGP